ncbi:MAG: ATP-grasp domain-containing protein [Coriobacteriales bacterium]|jgi:D-alanine-D-alanine ligase|nr:ATP-grasp domain-containing protein [Coriobacteriales bacterium]
MSYKLAVLMGGSSFEREFSLKSGRHVTETLRAQGHEVLPLDTDANLVETLRAQNVNAVYIALHGKGGEDGTIQALLEYLNIPYVGSCSHVSRTFWNKSSLPHAVLTYRQNAVDGPEKGAAFWPKNVSLAAISFKDMGAVAALDLIPKHLGSGPLAVKPARGGSAMGVNRVDNQKDVGAAILNAFSFDTAVIIEQWIEGIELAVGVVGNGNEAAILPPVEIVPKRGFFDTEARQNADLVDYYCPPRSKSLGSDKAEQDRALKAIELAALEVHKALGCRDLSRIDMIWDGTKPYVLEVNVSPGMTEHSLFPMASAVSSTSLGELLDSLLETAINRG